MQGRDLGMILDQGHQAAVFAVPGYDLQPWGQFQLKHKHCSRDLTLILNQSFQERRGNIVWQVAENLRFGRLRVSEGCEIDPENILIDKRDIIPNYSLEKF